MAWQSRGNLRGPAGADGTDGRSAYQIAVAGGFTGSESAWLQFLRGQVLDNGDGTAQWMTWTEEAQGPAGPAGGFLSGTYPSPGVNSAALDGATAGRVNDDLSSTANAIRQLLSRALGSGTNIGLSVDGSGAIVISVTGLAAVATSGSYTSLANRPAENPAAGTAGLRSLGTGSTQAAAGNHTHSSSAITDSTSTGRSLMTASDAAAARSTIGAVSATQLVLSTTAPSNPAAGTVWINTSTS